MPTLTLQRPRRFMNALRALRVQLDGTQILKLKNGEQQSVQIAAGSHTLTVRVDWMRSKPFHFVAAADDAISLVCLVDSSDLLETLKGSFGVASDTLRIAPADSDQGRTWLGTTPVRAVSWAPILRRCALWVLAVMAVGFGSAIYFESRAATPGAGEQVAIAIGRLAGLLAVGGVAWFVFQGSALRSASPAVQGRNRIALAIGLGVAALIGVGTSVGTAHRHGNAQRDFVRGCVSACGEAAADTDASQCQSYCGCMADALLGGQAGVTLGDIPDAEGDPVIRERLTRLQSACMHADSSR
jgi:hypothetical protein